MHAHEEKHAVARLAVTGLFLGVSGWLMAGCPQQDIAATESDRSRPSSPPADECRLLVLPAEGQRDVFIVPPGRPHCYGRILALEGFFCRNWKSLGWPEEVRSVDYHWVRQEDGSVTSTGQIKTGLDCQITMTPAPHYVSVTITVTNKTDKTCQDLVGVMCLNLRDNHAMFSAQADPAGQEAMTRTYVQTQDRLKPASRTDIHRSGAGGVMPLYFLQEPDLDHWMPNVLAGYGWVVSKDRLDLPLIAMLSRDGNWIAAEWFHPVHHVRANWMQPYHGCIHADPTFGTLKPGATAHAVGRLYLTPGPLNEAWPRMTRDYQQAAASSK